MVRVGESADASLYLSRVESALRGIEHKWGAEIDAVDDLDQILENADHFAELGDYTSAVIVYEAVVNGIIRHYHEYDDESGSISEFIDGCVETLSEYLTVVPEGNTSREKILHTLFAIYSFDVEEGGIAFGEEAGSILIERTTPTEWLQKHAALSHVSAQDLACTRMEFQAQATLQHYHEVRRLAAELGQWQQLRAELYSFLAEARLFELLTQVDLEEDSTDELIKVICDGSTDSETHNSVIALVEAAEEIYPNAVLKFYLQYVDYLISNRNRPAYEQASKFLFKVRALYDRFDAHDVWTRYIEWVRSKNSSLRALKNILDGAGL